MSTPPKRSLLLAGGGIKVAFQAGVLQVLLSEVENLRFDHYDACSGGAFSLVLLCDGRSGIEIADLWRRMHPFDGVSFSREGFRRGDSVVTMDGYVNKIFPRWELDWKRIRASRLDATFTVHNRSRGRRQVFTPKDMDEKRLVAALSQAVWFPPVKVGDELYTDAVFDTDANVDEALKRKVDEIWVIWTVSRRPEWMPGPVAQFFHALEESANGTLESDLERIRWNNDNHYALYGHRIEVKVLYAEVPMHYLALFNGDRLHRGVEQGVRAARAWCDARGIGYTPIDRSRFYDNQVRLRFTDHLSGRLGDCAAEADLTLIVTDAGEFMNAGEQRVEVCGTVTCALFHGMATVVGGYATILTDVRGPHAVQDDRGVIEESDGVDPSLKRMVYVLPLRISGTGRLVTLIGIKDIAARSVRGAVRNSMTMRCEVLEGHVDHGDGGEKLAEGILEMTFWDVATQLLKARSTGPNLKARAGGLVRYGALFAGSLWDVAARKWLTYAPF